MSDGPGARRRPAPLASYAVTARREHVESMAQAVSGARWFGPLPWFVVLTGGWLGLVLAMRFLPEALRVRPEVGWPVVLAVGVLSAWLSALLGRAAIRRKMRALLVERGWGPGTEHVAEHGEDWVGLRGPDSDVVVQASEVRRIHQRAGAVVLLVDGDAPVLTVAELFPAAELDRFRRAAGSG